MKPIPAPSAAKTTKKMPTAKTVKGPAKPPPKPAVKPAASKRTKPPAVKTAPPLATAKPLANAKPVPPTTKPPVAPVKSATKASAKGAKAATTEPSIPLDKDLSTRNGKLVVKDRITLTAPDCYWLNAKWELSYQGVQRAEASLGQDWHGARPILRLFDVTSLDTTSTSETAVKDIFIHGGYSQWFVDVPQPPRSYRVDIGYLSRRGEFKVLARSNIAATPAVGVSEPLNANWEKEIEEKSAERVLAKTNGFTAGTLPAADELDKKLSGKDSAFGTGALLPEKLKKFGFTLDAELIVSGRTDPTAHVTLQNDPVKLRPDGTFTMRYALTDGRQIIPAVAESSDGMEERTIVLAIERNTKHLDPLTHDMYGEN